MNYSALVRVALYFFVTTAYCVDTKIPVNTSSKKSSVKPFRIAQAISGIGLVGFGVSECDYLFRYLLGNGSSPSDDLILRSYIGSLTFLILGIGGGIALTRRAWQQRDVPVTMPLEKESSRKGMELAKNISKCVFGISIIALGAYLMFDNAQHVRSRTCEAPRWACLLRHYSGYAMLTSVVAYGCKLGVQGAMRLKQQLQRKSMSPAVA